MGLVSKESKVFIFLQKKVKFFLWFQDFILISTLMLLFWSQFQSYKLQLDPMQIQKKIDKRIDCKSQ